jgi:hypothetical protein
MGFIASVVPVADSIYIRKQSTAIPSDCPSPTPAPAEALIQSVLIRTLLRLTSDYQQTGQLAAIFTDAFLKKLLQLMLTPTNSEVRLEAQQVFQTLLDRHQNADGIGTLTHYCKLFFSPLHSDPSQSADSRRQ